MSLLSKLSLVVPSYNRQAFALRSMRYWSGSAVTVHVVDGSAAPIPAAQLDGIASNVTYHHDPAPLANRLATAAALVDTEYVALLGDDEFFLNAGLQACVAELEADPSLAACMGRCLAFQPTSGGIRGWSKYPEMREYSVAQDDPIARMIHHLNPYVCSTLYAVTRAPVWRQAMSLLPLRDFPVFAMVEVQFELAVAFQGKSKVIEHLSWLRSAENAGIREATAPRFDEWWLDPKAGPEKDDFLTVMAGALATNDVSATSIREGLAAACDGYARYSSDYFRTRRPRAAVANLIARLPQRLRRVARAALSVGPTGLLDAAEALEHSGVHVDWTELRRLHALIAGFQSRRESGAVASV